MDIVSVNEDYAIVCDNLGINFSLNYGRRKSLRKFTALELINLTIRNGERVGLLGRNGAGKSTLLRTFAGVFTPSKGSLEVRGNIATLFEATVGADPILSGYDNIKLMMAARQIPLRYLDKVTQDVEEFTELGQALHRPFGTYSNGMKLRLAFAIATVNGAEIVLIDEQIGVGDRDFQIKAQTRIGNMIANSGCLVLASHSNFVLSKFCQRGIVLDQGNILFDGPIDSAIEFQG